MKRKLTIAICLLLLLQMCPVTAGANSAQTYWEGINSTGAIVEGEDCPIVVEHEELTFDLQAFPLNYYGSVQQFLEYGGSVTAEYTFYNPADYTVTATLMFPFGNAPDYGFYELNKPQTETYMTKYGITVDGAQIEATLRHTLSYRSAQFELETDLAKLHDGFVGHDFYTPELQVVKYTYQVSGVPEDSKTSTRASVDINFDSEKTRAYIVDSNGGSTYEGFVRAERWVRPYGDDANTLELYVIGQQPEVMPEWSLHAGCSEEETEGTVTLVETETMTFREFALSAWTEDSLVSESDWYNAVVASMDENLWDFGLIGADFYLDVGYDLMRWYEYEITLEPDQRIVNAVTAPIYPSINGNYEPPIYIYTYLLSPAQTWTSFGSLDINVNTPYYLTECNLQGFEKVDGGYKLLLDGLPEKDLIFTLSAEENPSIPAKFNLFLLPLIGVCLVAAVIGIIIYLRKKK